MSNYNYGLESDIRSSGTSPLRLILIFLAVSALTAALVWWFWPGKEKEEEKKKEPAVEEVKGTEESAASSSKDSGSVAEVKESSAKGSTESSVAPSEEKQKNEEKPSEKTAVSANPVGGSDPTDPPIPPKGVVTENDRKGADLPVVPVDTPASEAQLEALKKAQRLLDAKDYAGAEKAALEALVNVAEYSEFYRKVWRVLTDARCRMAFSGKKQSLCHNTPYPQRRFTQRHCRKILYHH